MPRYPCRLYTDRPLRNLYGERTIEADSPSDAAVEYVQKMDAGNFTIAQGEAAWVEVEDHGIRLFEVRGVPQPVYEVMELATPRPARPGGAA